MRKLITAILALLMLTIISAGCSVPSGFIGKRPDTGESVKSTETSDVSGKNGAEENVLLRAWVFEESWLQWKDMFETRYPDVEVNFQPMYGGYINEYYVALASNTAPDILEMEEGEFFRFNSIEGLEDLLSSPYDAGSLKSSIAPGQWETFLSLDGSRLLALPVRSFQTITFYREDILAEYGFPSEPEELGEFLQDEENFFNLLYTLKQHDKWVIQWKEDMIFDTWMGFFDRNMMFTRNNDTFAKKLEFASRVLREGLVANMNIWSEDEREEIRKGNIPILLLGNWGDETLKAWAPESAGKWKATRMPLGNYHNWEVFAFSITSQSKHKQEAWDLVRFIWEMEDYVVKMALDKKSYYLGGQELNALCEELKYKVPPLHPTPLDGPAAIIWSEQLNDYLGSDGPATEVLAETENLMYQELARERKILLRYLNEGRLPNGLPR